MIQKTFFRHTIACACFLTAIAYSFAPANAADLTALTRAMERGQWGAALSEVREDGALRTYIAWRYLHAADHHGSLDQWMNFVSKHAEWPDNNRLRMRIEKSFFQSPPSDGVMRDWFDRFKPISGYGKLAMARLQPSHAKALATHAWISGDFERYDEQQIADEFGRYFDRQVHIKRVERLLQEGKASIAERLRRNIGADYAALLRARTALIRNERNLDRLIDAIPASLKNDHGLLYNRLRWRDKKGLESGARQLLQAMSIHSDYADAIWPIRAKYVRNLIEAKRYSEALRLLSNSGNKLTGAPQADALWMRGWVALEYQEAPGLAYELFYKLYHAVKYPVSKARGAYWAARAASAKGEKSLAKDWYRKAAQHPTTFYGQLAQAELHPGDALRLAEPPSASSREVSRFTDHPLLQATTALTRAGFAHLADPLVTHIARELSEPEDFAALARACMQLNLPFAQVRVAKFALRHHVVLPVSGWPMMSLPDNAPVSTALAHAIIRQESEFNRQAVSRAGARGLMQLMPATAKREARRQGIGYHRSQLFEPSYNTQLGTHYLGGLVNQFDGSYILAIAGYNAGPGRSNQWVKRFGQPGQSLHQTINWIETIPFAETRNYVQRVLENTQLYRALLKPGTPLRIREDLLR